MGLRGDDPSTVAESLTADLRSPVRDQGFRRAVVSAYEHTCALCGVRVRTLDGHTVVDAAHTVPWRVGRDDRLANGMALCRTCHWTFDEGLLAVSASYRIISSHLLRTAGNLPGYLAGLQGRNALVPRLAIQRPDPKSLGWHQGHVFRAA